MVMGIYLAALDNNFNSERMHDTVQTGVNAGEFKYKIAWRKPTKRFIAQKVYEKKRYDYLKVMLGSVYKRAEKGGKRKSRKRIMAPSERDSREDIVNKTKKLSRFSK